MRGQRFGMIINPYARQVKRRYLMTNRRFWESWLSPKEYLLPDGIDKIQNALKELLARETMVLGILGGDGTIHTTLNELFKLSPSRIPAILPFRGGTINAVCNNLGIKDSPEETFKKYIGISPSHPTQLFKHLIKVQEFSNGERELRYGFSFANGVFPRIYKVYYSYKNPGFGSALRIILKLFVLGPFRPKWVSELLKPSEMRIRVQRKELISEQVRVLAISTLESPTLWWKPFGAELDGRPAFHYLANAMSTPELVLNMFDLFVGRCEHPKHWVGEANQLELEFDTGYVLDGETYGLNQNLKAQIELGPAIRFISV